MEDTDDKAMRSSMYLYPDVWEAGQRADDIEVPISYLLNKAIKLPPHPDGDTKLQ